MKNYIGSTLLIVALLGISLNSYSGTVKPQSSFGVATDVKAGVMITQNGTKVDFIAARNARGDIFFGQSTYTSDGTYYKADSGFDARVRSANGAISNGTVKATIEHKVPKRSVIDEMLKKAKVGGKMLGKGAATVGRVAASNNPYVRAFSLVMLALEATNSGIKWDEDKSEFMRLNDDNTYVVLESSDVLYLGGTSSVVSSRQVNEQMIEATCKEYRCSIIGFEIGRQNAYERALRYCQSNNFDSIGHAGYCQSGSMVSFSYGVIAYRYTGYTTVSEDDFYNEIEKEVDKNPADWVETSEIKPTDEPKVDVPVGTVAQSDPYTDPKDGKAKQTRWDFDTNGRVRETEILRPDLTPNSPQAPELRPPVVETQKNEDGDGESEKDKEQSETKDLCEKNPNIMACDEQPEKPDEHDFEIPQETKDLLFTPDTIFPTTGTCPAPVSFRVDIPFAGAKTFEFDTMPVCEIARRLRNLLIAIAWLVTAVFCFHSFSKGS